MATDQALLDLLSEMLAVERDGARLYAEFLADAPDELRVKLLEYAEQSRRSALVVEEAVRRLGGDPALRVARREVAHRGCDRDPRRGGPGAHMADRNDERISWALAAMQSALGREFRVETRTGRRGGLDRPR